MMNYLIEYSKLVLFIKRYIVSMISGCSFYKINLTKIFVCALIKLIYVALRLKLAHYQYLLYVFLLHSCVYLDNNFHAIVRRSIKHTQNVVLRRYAIVDKS